MEKEKHNKYYDIAKSLNVIFLPFVMEYYGGIAPEALQFLSHLLPTYTSPAASVFLINQVPREILHDPASALHKCNAQIPCNLGWTYKSRSFIAPLRPCLISMPSDPIMTIAVLAIPRVFALTRHISDHHHLPNPNLILNSVIEYSLWYLCPMMYDMYVLEHFSLCMVKPPVVKIILCEENHA